MARIETKTAETILQRPMTITLGGKEYEVAPPSIATLIGVSEAVTDLPDMDDLDAQEAAFWTFRNAKKCQAIVKATSILIMGERDYTKDKKKRKSIEESVRNCQPKELLNAISTMLGGLQVTDFFAVTAFLSGVNLLKTEKTMTVPGR